VHNKLLLSDTREIFSDDSVSSLQAVTKHTEVFSCSTSF
jgi:hypothetical protein